MKKNLKEYLSTNGIKYIVFIILLVIVFIVEKVFGLSLQAILVVLFLILGIFYFIDRFFVKREEEKFIEENLVIGKKMILESNEFSVLVTKGEKVLWANNHAYNEFPILLQKRFIETINLDKLDIDNRFTFNNNIYQCSIKNDVYTIHNITKSERQSRTLAEFKPNIAIFQIDNYNYLSDSLDEALFIKLISDLKMNFSNIFNEKKIHHQTISKDKMQLLIPTSELNNLIESKFTEFNKIISEFQDEDLPISYSIGISTNQTSFQEAGRKANDALELAITRGGAQVVIVDADKRILIGGGNSVIKVNVRIKARVISNTLLNVVRKRDVIYIMSHKHPDSDSIASMLLMRDFILQNVEQAKVKILVDENQSKNIRQELEAIIGDDYYENSTVDKTMKNIVIVVDTQSNDIISHPKILEQVNDKIIFDHHQTPVNYIERSIFNWIEPASSSTTELILEMYSAKDLKINNRQFANLCLFAILTDSNNLKYSTGQHTLEAMSLLVACGGNIEIAREKQYLSFDKFTKLNDLILGVKRINNMTVIEVENEEDQILLSMAVNEALEIRNIVASIIFSSRSDGMFFVKMRSTHEINSKLFLEEFGGGGHARQGAGIITKVQKEEIIKKIENL
ncbi:MAG: DHH family phosphoesterase [Mycoplasmatales bacterium]